jgi:fission process protein 1
MVKRGVFQALASMALPAFTVHSVVKYSVIGFKNVKNVKVKAWGPTLLGLSVVPFLPYIFDEPVEHIVDRVFEPIEKMVTSESIARLGHNKAGDELPIVEEDKKVVLESKKDQ